MSGQNPPKVTIYSVAIAGVASAVSSTSVRSKSKGSEPGCRRRRQTGEPSELRYETQFVSCQAGEPRGTVRVRRTFPFLSRGGGILSANRYFLVFYAIDLNAIVLNGDTNNELFCLTEIVLFDIL